MIARSPGDRLSIDKVCRAPLIEECYANFECRLADASLVHK